MIVILEWLFSEANPPSNLGWCFFVESYAETFKDVVRLNICEKKRKNFVFKFSPLILALVGLNKTGSFEVHQIRLHALLLNPQFLTSFRWHCDQLKHLFFGWKKKNEPHFCFYEFYYPPPHHLLSQIFGNFGILIRYSRSFRLGWEGWGFRERQRDVGVKKKVIVLYFTSNKTILSFYLVR